MEHISFDYNGKMIEFILGSEVMVNATEMGAVFGHTPYNFTRLEKSKKFLKTLKKSSIAESQIEDYSIWLSKLRGLDRKSLVQTADNIPILVITRGDEPTTYMHRYLAIDYAMYLDDDFKLWIIKKIDYLFTSYSQKQRAIAARQNEIKKTLKRLILENPNNRDLQKYHALTEELKSLAGQKAKSSKDQYSIWFADE